MTGRIWLRGGLLAAGVALAACSASNDGTRAESSEMSPDAPVASAHVPKDPRVEAWRKVVAKTPAPKEGCFTVTYPSTTWTEEPCAPAVSNPIPAPSRRLFGGGTKSEAESPAGGAGVPAVGNGTDWYAQTSSATTSATGSFPYVSGVSTVSSADGSNAYSLQVNTNQFPSSACSGGLAGCQAAMQAVFYGQSGNADIWYVLLNYYSGSGGCPSSSWQGVGGTCYLEESNYQVNVGAQPVSNLSALSLSAIAGSPNVTMTMSAGGGTVKSVGVPNVVGLGGAWTNTDFNIFGDGGGDRASFAGTPTIQVQTEVQSATSPTCSPTAPSSTVETNSLNLVPNCCVASGNAITFLESGVTGQSCTLCGAQGQTCCSAGTGCSSPGDVCYGGTCTACGGSGEVCCTGNTCGSGLACQQGLCGVQDGLTASPADISAAQGDGAAISVNYASTEVTLTGAWASSDTTQPTFSYEGLPEGVSCVPSSGFGPGPTKVTCTTSADTPTSASANLPNGYPIKIVANIGSISESTTIYLTVTACQPDTCSNVGYVCGSLDNGCGETLNCGSCASGDSCVAGVCTPTCNKYCPPPEFLDPYTCTCDSCKCGTIIVGGHRICNVCKP